jgi:hypothetical protein
MVLWSLDHAGCWISVEVRFPWRGVVLNWLFGFGGMITAYLVLALQCSPMLGGVRRAALRSCRRFAIVDPAYPIAARIVAMFDRFRLIPVIGISDTMLGEPKHVSSGNAEEQLRAPLGAHRWAAGRGRHAAGWHGWAGSRWPRTTNTRPLPRATASI